MARPVSETLTPAEQRVLAVLWDKGEASVRDVVEALAPERRFAYTTVLTMLRILVSKDYARARAVGRAHLYSPIVTERAARRAALRRMVGQFFGGSSAALVEHLIEEGEIDPEELKRLEARLAEDGEGAG